MKMKRFDFTICCILTLIGSLISCGKPENTKSEPRVYSQAEISRDQNEYNQSVTEMSLALEDYRAKPNSTSLEKFKSSYQVWRKLGEKIVSKYDGKFKIQESGREATFLGMSAVKEALARSELEVLGKSTGNSLPGTGTSGIPSVGVREVTTVPDSKVQLEDRISKIQFRLEQMGLFIVSSGSQDSAEELLWHWEGQMPDVSRSSEFVDLLKEYVALCEQAEKASTVEPIKMKYRLKAKLLQRTLQEGLSEKLRARLNMP